MTAAKRVTIGGRSYLCSFAHLFRPLAPKLRAGLEASIRQYGVLDDVVVCTVDGVRTFLDGMNRAEISIKLGIPCGVNDRGEMTRADAERLARDKYALHRHLPLDELERQLELAERDRKTRVIERVAAGESVRSAAKAEEVSYSTAQRITQPADDDSDDDSGDPRGSPERPGERVVKGADGKPYRQAPKAAPSALDLARADLHRARVHARGLQAAWNDLLSGPLRDSILSAAATAGHPVHADDCWPPLVLVAAVLGAAG